MSNIILNKAMNKFKKVGSEPKISPNEQDTLDRTLDSIDDFIEAPIPERLVLYLEDKSTKFYLNPDECPTKVFDFILKEEQLISKDQIMLFTSDNKVIRPNETLKDQNFSKCSIFASYEILSFKSMIQLLIRSCDKRSNFTIYASPNQPLRNVFEKFLEEQKKYKFENVKFVFDGQRLKGTESPSELDMESGDIIDMHELREAPPIEYIVID